MRMSLLKNRAVRREKKRFDLRQDTPPWKRRPCLALAAFFAVCWALCFALTSAAHAEGELPEYTSLEELSHKTIGTVLGTTYDMDVWNLLDEDPEFRYYSEMSEMLIAIKYGRIDACCLDEPVARIAVERNEGLAIVPEDAGLDANAVALPKHSPLTGPVSKAVQKMLDNGTIDLLEREWCDLSSDTEAKLPDVDWSGANGKLLCAVDDATEPMSFRNARGELVGLEVELSYLIARELNRELVLVPMSFDAVMSALSTGSVDMAIAGISITDERAEAFDLTPAYRSALVTLVTRNANAGEKDFFAYVGQTFRASFLNNGHGGMFLFGLLVTLAIALVSVPLGIAGGHVLGLFIAVLSAPQEYSGLSLAQGPLWYICKGMRAVAVALETIMTEVPVVIVLLILRYLVFDLMSESGFLVAVIGLSAALAATTSNAIRESIAAVSKEQKEAAIAMGYTPWLALMRVVLPLARKNYTPILHAAILQTVFDTSVVGLIAVHDVTRVADLIRARTTEALPAMFATVVVYLCLSKILEHVLQQYTNRQDRKRL